MDAVSSTTETVSIADIDQERAGILKGVLFGILRSDAAQKVIAQVIDGLPTEDTYELRTTKRFALLQRLEPSHDSMARAGQFCTYEEMFDNLQLNARIIQLYQLAPLKSYFFNMHLLELVAIAIHDFIGDMFTACHPNGEPPQKEGDNSDPVPEGAISLSTICYTKRDQYPKGVVDVVGYWAESHIFGGVVVFDRGELEGARNCFDAYLHLPECEDVVEILDYQLAQFASLGAEDGLFTLPFTCEPKARRIDNLEAFYKHNIYRDRFEREIQEDELQIEQGEE